jgi:hypothetical protein
VVSAVSTPAVTCHDAAVMIQNNEEQKEFSRVFWTAVTTQKKT